MLWMDKTNKHGHIISSEWDLEKSGVTSHISPGHSINIWKPTKIYFG
jgi:hypothetical protein